jgi:hypothetical protein
VPAHPARIDRQRLCETAGAQRLTNGPQLQPIQSLPVKKIKQTDHWSLRSLDRFCAPDAATPWLGDALASNSQARWAGRRTRNQASILTALDFGL